TNGSTAPIVTVSASAPASIIAVTRPSWRRRAAGSVRAKARSVAGSDSLLLIASDHKAAAGECIGKERRRRGDASAARTRFLIAPIVARAEAGPVGRRYRGE